MALTDAERMQMVTIALMKHNVIGGGGVTNPSSCKISTIIINREAYFPDVQIEEVVAQ